MILELYGEFLARHCSTMSSDDVQRLTTSLCGYLSRAGKAGRLRRLAKEFDLEDEVLHLRRKLDGNPYASSCLWRAVWLNFRGHPGKAIRKYKIKAEDLEWVIANLSVKHIRKIEELSAGDWLRMPDYDGIRREVLSMAPYCQRYVKRLSFIVKYDPGLTLEDFINDMLAAGLSAAYRSDHRTTDLVWLRNIAWCSAKNHAVSIIKHHTTKGRQRIERHEQGVAVQTKITTYQRSACWRCKHPSTSAVCQPCATEIKTSKDEATKWKSKSENASSFIKKRASVSVKTCEVTPDEGFISTMAYLDAPLGRQTEDGNATLLDAKADHISPTTYVSPETADLVHDLRRQPEAVQRVCAAILGDRDDAFESWLVARHGKGALSIRDRKLTSEACEFYGIPRSKLRTVMAPILGVVSA
jgi:ribosomal protein L11